MGLYLDNGYINQQWIVDTCMNNQINFVYEIGKRQIGKTYNALFWCMLRAIEFGEEFILMRRTSNEMDFICNDVNNPFKVFEKKGYKISIERDSKYTAGIYYLRDDSDKIYIGAVMALSTIAKIRGFYGGRYKYLVYDECIPENHVQKIKMEDDAFNNAYQTINGERENEGEAPLLCFLLANSNSINAPILKALNVTNKVAEMEKTNQEYSIMTKRGIMIIRPKSEKIMKTRKDQALFRAIGKDTNFTRMSLGNSFSYNDDRDVQSLNLSDFKLVLQFGDIFIYKHIHKNLLYFSSHKKGNLSASKIFTQSNRDVIYIANRFPDIHSMFVSKLCVFESTDIKYTFINLFNL